MIKVLIRGSECNMKNIFVKSWLDSSILWTLLVSLLYLGSRLLVDDVDITILDYVLSLIAYPFLLFVLLTLVGWIFDILDCW